MSVNQSISETKKNVALSVAERRKKYAKSTADMKSHTNIKVALEVSPTEVLPIAIPLMKL